MKLVITQTDTLAQITVAVQGLVAMPAATGAALGAVIAGDGLAVDAGGVLSLAPPVIVAAAGTSQAGAAALSGRLNIVTAVPAGGGVVLPAALASGDVVVRNAGAADLLVYPPGTAQIDAAAAGVPVVVSAGTTARFASLAPSSQWYAL